MRVLVVDDDTYIRMMLAIELPDVELLEASRVDEAYELARQERPDAIVVDRRLPDGDGLDLVRRLRMTHPTSRTPIVMATAAHDEAQRATVVQAGADVYLPKPIEPAALAEHVSRMLALPAADRRPRRKMVVERIRQGEVVAVDEGMPVVAHREPATRVRPRWWRKRRS